MDTKANRDALWIEPIHTQESNTAINLSNKQPTKALWIYGSNQDGGRPYVFFAKGSLTVEAAFSTVIFFIALFSVMYIFLIIDYQNHTKMVMEHAVYQYESHQTKHFVFDLFWIRSFPGFWDSDKHSLRAYDRRFPYL